MYPWRNFADVGGLLSYGNSLNDAVPQAGLYTGRILNGDLSPKAVDDPSPLVKLEQLSSA
jgi:hypothetical protein